MKLALLYEYLVAHPDGLAFYGDPKAKKANKGKKAIPTGTSMLVGGSADRDRYVSKMGLAKNKKRDE